MIYRTETRGRHTFPGVSTRLDMFSHAQCDYGERSIVVRCGIPGVIPLTRVDRPRQRGEFFPGGALAPRPPLQPWEHDIKRRRTMAALLLCWHRADRARAQVETNHTNGEDH